MRIGIFASVLQNGGGIYQYTHFTLKALREWDTAHEFVIITLPGNQLPLDAFSGDRWRVMTIDPKMTRVKNIAPYLSGDGLDLVRSDINSDMQSFFQEQGIDLLIAPAPVAFFSEWGVPYIMAVHDLQHRLQPEFPEVSAGNLWQSREYLYRNGVRYAQAVMTDSEVGREDVLNFYKDHISPERVYPLPFLPYYRPGDKDITEAAKQEIRKKYDLPNEFLFYPAQFWLHKNHSRLIHALHILRVTHNIEAPLVLSGSNPAGLKDESRELVFNNAMLLAEQLDVKDLVRYIGFVPDEDMPALYTMAKALTMPTFFGPTNIPFLEAWAFGCPVLTSDIRGIREQVENAGLLVNPEDAYHMADAILKLWTDDDLGNALRGAGYEKVACYTPNDFAQRLYNIIEEVGKGLQKTSRLVQASEVENDKVRKLNQQGESLCESGDVEDALKCFEKALEMAPRDAVVHNNMGVVCYARGDKEKALHHYEKAAEIEPLNRNFKKNIADFYYVELGQTKEALEIYLRLLSDDPEDIEILMNLGHICVSLNKIGDAKTFFRRVLDLEPLNMDARQKVDELKYDIEEEREQGTEEKSEDAVVGSQQPFSPDTRGIDSPERLYGIVQNFVEEGREKEAIGALSIFLELFPDEAVAHNDLGVLYLKCAEEERALEHYEHAARLDAGNGLFQKNLAEFYFWKLGRVQDALKIYENLVSRNPEDIEALVAIGHICTETGDSDRAIDSLNRVLENDPGNTDAIEKLRQVRKGIAQSMLNRPPEEISNGLTGIDWERFQKLGAAGLKDYPLCDDEDTFLKPILKKMSNPGESSDIIRGILVSILYCYPHELSGMPVLFEVPEWLQEAYCDFMLSCPRCFTKRGEVDRYARHMKQVFESLYKAIQQSPHAKTAQKLATILSQKAYLIPVYFSSEDLAELYAHRGAIAEFAFRSQGYQLDYRCPKKDNGNGKIKVGIYAKVIGPGTEAFATLPLYEHLNRKDFEILLYVHQRNGNRVEVHAENVADRLIELPNDLRQSAEIIRSDALDVLFFSNGVTAVTNHAFILANHRLAPFQCVHFCQPVTTGLKHMDYFFLGDLVQNNGTQKARFYEQIVPLEGSGICFELMDRNNQFERTINRNEMGIPEDATVFISGANLFKITPELRHLWARLLRSVPQGVLVLYPFGPAWSSSYPKTLFRDDFENIISGYGVAKEQLLVLDRLPAREDIKALLRVSDVYLDAVPYSGATSLLDPLEVGIPPVVMEGPELRFRQGAAILKELGLEDLVVTSEAAYLELAERLANDSEARIGWNAKILERMADTPPFLDCRAYAENVGAALKDITKGSKKETSLARTANG